MKIIKEKTKHHQFAFEFDYDKEVVEYCRYLKDKLGWQQFHFTEKKWRFVDPFIMGMIMEKYPGTVNESGVSTETDKIDPIEIKGLKKELYDYQKDGVKFFVESKGRAILADTPGVGKTAQALAYKKYAGFKRTLVVCPASVKYSWENEIKKWTNFSYFIVDPKTNMNDIPYDTNIIIINYDILKKFFNELMKLGLDLIIADESHYVKERTSIRSKALNALAKQVDHVLLLTGTPMLSKPVELFNLLNMVDPVVWNNWYNFTQRYCGGQQTYWGYEAKGATNLEELNQRISRYFLRRTKEEVLPQLPPKNRISVPVDMPDEYFRQYVTAAKDLVKYLREFKKANKDTIVSALSAEKIRRLMVLREIVSMSKISMAKEIIQSIIDSGEKVVVFDVFIEPLRQLYKHFEDQAVILTGETPVGERGELVDRFQNNPDTKIFFAGIKSGGAGITLTAGTNVLFMGFSWNPADGEQAENRIHRPGQKASSVNIYQMEARGTIDGFMKKLLAKKQDIIDKVIEGGDVDEVSVADELIDAIKDEYEN